MIALPHLLFLTALAVGAWSLWIRTANRADWPALTGQAVVMGVGTGLLIGAWL